MIALAIVAAAAIAALAFIALRSQLAPGPRLTGCTVIVTTCKPDDRSIRGILVAQHADRVSLSEAVVLHGSGDQAAGGLLHIPLGQVAVIQEIDAGGSA